MIVLPWHNPVLLAEQAATIDLLSGGRLEFGVGKGYRHDEFASFCIPQEEADERFEEGLALILKSWTSEQRFSHHGKFWHFEDIIVEPPTAQKPHPPIWMGAGSPDSIRKVARRGSKLLLDQLASTPLTIERFNIYKAEVEKPGPALRSDGCRRQPRLLRRQERRGEGQGHRDAARQPAAAGQGSTPSPGGNSNIASLLSFDQTLDAAGDSALFGTPDEIAAKLEMLRAAGIEHMLLNGPAGSRENLRAFARDVMPAFAGSRLPQAPARTSASAQPQAREHAKCIKTRSPEPSAASRR